MTNLMYLIDTNVWLERLLDQARSNEVGKFFDNVPSERLFITDFAFHSISLVMSRLNRTDGLLRFVRDAFIEGAVVLIHLQPADTESLVRAMEIFKLDFDDSYQYVAAEKYDLTVITYDTDFDRTPRGRKTPEELLS